MEGQTKEVLNEETFNEAIFAILKADMIIVMGSIKPILTSKIRNPAFCADACAAKEYDMAAFFYLFLHISPPYIILLFVLIPPFHFTM